MYMYVAQPSCNIEGVVPMACVCMQVLCRAIEASGTFGAQQVVKNERGEEVSPAVV